MSETICVQYSLELNLNIRRQLFYSSVPAEGVTILVVPQLMLT